MQKIRVFYLGNLLPISASNRAIIGAAKKNYPQCMIQESDWYMIIKYRTKKVIDREEKFLYEGENCLERLIDRIESSKSSAVVISFSKKDFEEFDAIVAGRRLWGTREQIDDVRHYIVHTYVHAPKPAPPNLK